MIRHGLVENESEHDYGSDTSLADPTPKKRPKRESSNEKELKELMNDVGTPVDDYVVKIARFMKFLECARKHFDCM